MGIRRRSLSKKNELHVAGKIGLGVVLALLVAGAVIVLAPLTTGAATSIHVDDKAGDKQDGSFSHPYKSIQKAIDKAAKDKKDVFVHSGTYYENFEIWDDVDVIGENRDSVVIFAKDSDQPVVTMDDDTELRKVTVAKGERGVYVKGNARTTIDNCRITENKKDGIKAKEGKTDNEHRLDIFDSEITDNGWNGIYSETRKFKVIGNLIADNEKAGLEFEKDSEGDIEDNRIKDNEGDGAKLTVDGSDIWTKNNTYYGNERDGLEIRTKGETGKIIVNKSKFYKNDRYGIALIEKSYLSTDDWHRSVIIESDNLFVENEDGKISPIIAVD